MDPISSRSNPRIKAIRSLRTKKARDERGSFLVEGIRHVGEAVDAGAEIEEIYFAPEKLHSAYAFELVRQQDLRGIPCFQVSTEVFDTLSDKENPQGILAVIRKPRNGLMDLTPDNFLWGVAVITPQDPGNLGTILRTVDAVGANGTILLDGGVDQYHPSAVRASMGALFWQRVVSASFGEFAGWAKRSEYYIYGSSARSGLEYNQLPRYRVPCILLLGSEREGLTSDQAAICHSIVRLPMHGKTTSLNLAVAAGVLLYDMLGRGFEREITG